jgi:hypothetical protein
MMKLLSQRDPQWSGVSIGESSVTLRESGCVVTDIAMLSDWYSRYRNAGKYRNPGKLAKKLKFTSSGLLYWSSIEAYKSLGFKFTWRFYRYDESRILPALRGKNTTCLLRLYHGSASHWVVGIRKVGSYYLVADPYPLPSGKRRFVHKKHISGGSTFDIK